VNAVVGETDRVTLAVLLLLPQPQEVFVTNWVRVLSLCAVSMTAASASAQIEPRAFKLSVDTNFLSFNRQLLEEGESSQTSKVTSFGPMPATGGLIPGYVGLSLGYVVHPHVIPELQVGFGVSKLKSESESGDVDGATSDEDGPKITELMLRPMAEIPFNPASKIVVAGVVGLDFRLLKYKEESDGESEESKVRGIGPVLGVKTHFFVIERGSIDVGALFSYNALKEESKYTFEGQTETDESDPDKFNSLTFGLTLGLSLWPGPANAARGSATQSITVE
jgi:hypothetical protein